jgi:mono/diheme cytochrome c family protein
LRRLAIILGGLAVLALLLAPATGQAGQAPVLAQGQPASPTTVGTRAGVTTSTAAGLSELEARGRELYLNQCASCHGADLRGTDRGPSHLSIVYEPGHHSDESFRAAIRDGAPQHHWRFGDMPPVEGLDDAEIDAVIAYVREVQEREGFEPYPPD